MKPLHDNILVELVEEEGVLKIVNDMYAVVKIKDLPHICRFNEDYWTENIKVDKEVLVTYVRDYLVKDKKYYFVKFQDIVAIL